MSHTKCGSIRSAALAAAAFIAAMTLAGCSGLPPGAQPPAVTIAEFGVGNQAVTVPRYGSAFMQVEAVSTLGGLIKQFGRIAQGDRAAFKYRLKGALSIAGGTRIPFEQRGEFDFAGLAQKP